MRVRVGVRARARARVSVSVKLWDRVRLRASIIIRLRNGARIRVKVRAWVRVWVRLVRVVNAVLGARGCGSEHAAFNDLKGGWHLGTPKTRTQSLDLHIYLHARARTPRKLHLREVTLERGYT